MKNESIKRSLQDKIKDHINRLTPAVRMKIVSYGYTPEDAVKNYFETIQSDEDKVIILESTDQIRNNLPIFTFVVNSETGECIDVIKN